MDEALKDAGYEGYVGIEWEGGKPSEHEGILLTKRILAANGCKPAKAGDGPFEYKAG